MQIKVQVLGNTLTPSLRRNIRALQNPQPVMRAMGTVIVSLAQRSFTDASLRPTSWPDLSPKTLRRRRAEGYGSRPLLRTGVLSRSPRVVSASGTSVVVASDRSYAKYQQFGTAHIPARPFFPFDHNGRPTPKASQLLLAAATRALRLRS